jgi:hypothetical protein
MTFAQAFRTSHRAAVDALDGELALAGARILLVSSGRAGARARWPEGWWRPARR